MEIEGWNGSIEEVGHKVEKLIELYHVIKDAFLDCW